MIRIEDNWVVSRWVYLMMEEINRPFVEKMARRREICDNILDGIFVIVFYVLLITVPITIYEVGRWALLTLLGY